MVSSSAAKSSAAKSSAAKRAHMGDRHRGDAGERTESPGDAFHDPAVDVVERIAQGDDGFGVAGDAELAREEQGVAVERAVDQVEQMEKRARDRACE
jgi:hypothetical protein